MKKKGTVHYTGRSVMMILIMIKNIFVVLVLNHNHDNTLNQNLSECHQMEVSLSFMIMIFGVYSQE